jgi:molecular chaperone GrpE
MSVTDESREKEHMKPEHTGDAETSDVENPDAAKTAVPPQNNDTSENELDVLRNEIVMLREQVLRKVAEFENFKRRTRDEKDALLKYGAEGVISDLLPVIDDFERSLSAGKEHPDFESIYSGVEIIYAKLLRVLQNRGLSAIVAVGKPFDTDFHDALLQIPNAKVEPGTVLDEAEKGYMLHDKVIRHAKVTVSREADQTTEEGA